MKNKRENINLLLSAFLVIGFVVSSYFLSLSNTFAKPINDIFNVAIFVVFGLLLFYATRVGDGKARVRFSLLTLIILDLPALYIIVATIATGLPFHAELAQVPTMFTLAGVALGYGIPYTFISGFELVTEEIITDMPAVEGGVAEDVEATVEAETTYTESDEEEIVVEGTNVIEDDAVESTTIEEAVSEDTEDAE